MIRTIGPIRADAELFVRKMAAGRNGAVHLIARREDGAPVDCVVKLAKAMASEQATQLPIAYLCEWLATAFGQVLGIQVPTPYEIMITSEYAESIIDPAQRDIARASLGTAFGSGHVSAGTTQYTVELPDPSLRIPAAALVAFDVLIHNVDRRRDNPNLFVSRGGLLAFDHGDAFSYLLPILLAPDPVTDALDAVVAQHACWSWLHNREFSFDPFKERLMLLTDDILREIADATPLAWQVGPANGKLEQIIDVTKKRRDAVVEWLPKVEVCLKK